MRYFFTSESVTEGHPDKVCDRISDSILDALLQEDPFSRCACETIAEAGAVHIMGEISTKAHVDYVAIARKCIEEIGYTKEEYGFDAGSCRISCSLHEQSPDIAMGVDDALETRGAGNLDIGAGDQGMMFGFACDETEELMPLPISLAHSLAARLTQVRRTGLLPYLRPDGKTQVTIAYEDGRPAQVDTVVVSAQHDPDVDMDRLREDIIREVVRPSIPERLWNQRIRILVNPTGRFVLGGPAADTGLTGRKIIVDTYGGYSRHGGGAFSGKDPTKVDRSGAYMARKVAKTIVAAGAAQKCEVQFSYAIGVAQPVSVMVDTFGTGRLSDELLCDWIRARFDLRPGAIIEHLQLRKPGYAAICCYGHMGKPDASWEQVDADAIAGLRALMGEAEQA